MALVSGRRQHVGETNAVRKATRANADANEAGAGGLGYASYAATSTAASSKLVANRATFESAIIWLLMGTAGFEPATSRV